MKKLIFLLAFQCLMATTGFSQEFCGTPPPSPELINDEDLMYAGYPGPYHIKVYFHIIRRTNETGGYTETEIQSAMDRLTEDFDDHDIFFVFDCDYNYIDNTDYFDDGPTKLNPPDPPYYNIFQEPGDHADGVDIYLFPPSASRQGGAAAGIAENSELFVSGSFWRDPFSPVFNSTILSHEMGHVLGLLHTFDTDAGVELVNDPNCQTNGDLICSTPASPNLGWCTDPPQCEFTSLYNTVDEICESFGSNIPTDPIGDPYMPDTKNIMEYTHIDCAEYFVNEQGQRMRNSIATRPVLQLVQSNADLCHCKEQNDIHINNNPVFYNGEQNINGTLYVHSGAELTITSKVNLTDNSLIIVERGARLIVDGGFLTACTNEWQGIRVEGNACPFSPPNPGCTSQEQPDPFGPLNPDDAGVLIVKNGSVIEKSKTLITTANYQHPWPSFQEYFGGVIYAENSTFQNCDRAVEIMKYGTGFLKDKSRFFNCTFDSEKHGITIWSSNGIVIEGSVFNDQIVTGILPYNTETFVRNGNVFNNTDIGINVVSTIPLPYSSKIGDISEDPNDFNLTQSTLNGIGVYGNSNIGADPLTIVNNNFLGGVFGVYMDGKSHVRIEKNDFLNTILGSVFISTGDSENLKSQNNISSNAMGSQVVNDNSGMVYLDNCFSSNSVDILVSESSSINLAQGSEALAAGNCFTKFHNSNDIPEIDNQSGITIDYFVQEDEPINSCKYPENSVNITIRFADSETENVQCGSTFSPGTIDINKLCDLPETNQELYDQIDELDDMIELTENDENLTESYKNYLLSLYRRCLNKTIHHLAKTLLGNTREFKDTILKEEAIDLYSERAEFDLQIMAYGIMVHFGELDRARNFLNGLAPGNSEENDFIWTQLLNLDYLSQPMIYNLTRTDSIQLRNIAINTEPLAGFARSLFLILTGERIQLNIPPYNGQHIIPRTVTNTHLEFNIWPNPIFDGSFNIVSSKPMDGRKYHLQIHSLQGQKMFDHRYLHLIDTRLDCQTWPKGVYIVIIKEQGIITHKEKLIIF